MTGIYMFTNKFNEKSYIGQSTNIERRHKEHRTRKNEDTLFHDAINEYGFENFYFSVIEICDAKELNDKEVYYIKEYNTLYPNGYNLSEGGHFGHPMRLSSADDVFSIISLLKSTNMTNTEIGLLYGVSDQTISDINNGRIWRKDELVYPIRSRKIQKRHCENCGKELYKYNKGRFCRKCMPKMSIELSISKKEPPVSKEDLLELLCKNSFVQVGKIFGVSDNAIRKWCDKYGIPRHSNYYRNLVL